MHVLGKSFCFRQIRFARFAPDHVCKRCVTLRTRDRLVETGAYAKETFRRSLAGEKFAIALIHIVRQKGGAVRVRARNQDHWHVANVGR